MSHYIALIEESGPDTAIGVWFPDLPGCFSAGDTIEEAMVNATEALSLYAASVENLPPARTMTEMKADPSIATELSGHLFALIALAAGYRSAAE